MMRRIVDLAACARRPWAATGRAFVLEVNFQYRANDGEAGGNTAMVRIGALDRDGDGLAGFVEAEIGSATDSTDTDGDRTSDQEEYLARRDPKVNEAAVITIIQSLFGSEP